MDPDRPLFVDTGRGLSVKYKDRWIYSSRAPRATALEAAAATSMLPDTVYIIPSPCLGYGLAELLASLHPSSAILCIEAEPPLAELARQACLGLGSAGALPPGLALAPPEEAVRAYRSLETSTGGRRFRRAVEVRLSGGRSLADAAYDKALGAVSDDISTRHRNRLSLVRMGRLWARNVIANLACMRWDDVQSLPACSKPIVVCGAGPSLDTSFALLRRHREELFVLSCDTAAGALFQAGILPDAVVCLEAQVYNVADYLPLGQAATRHVIDLSAHPSTFRAVRGPVTLVSSEWAESNFLSRLSGAGLPVHPVPPLGSVGVVAVHIARTMGGPILAAGLDFSFPPGKTHCTGSPGDLRERRIETRTAKRPGAWNASFREGVRPHGGAWIDDPALSMYAGLASSELEGAEAYDIRSSQCAALPAVKLAPEEMDDAIRKIAGNTRCTGARYGSDPPGNPGTWRRLCREFLGSELSRIESIATMLREGADPGTLAAGLAQADILYAHFPDPERVLTLEHDALRRVAAETAYWRGRIEAALELSGS
jgi:hypothetical protein